MRSQSAKPLLVRIKSRGFSIEAVPFFSLDAAGWKAKAFVWRHAVEPVEQFVNDPTFGEGYKGRFGFPVLPTGT